MYYCDRLVGTYRALKDDLESFASMADILSKVELDSIRPPYHDRCTLRTLFSNNMAWRLAGKELIHTLMHRVEFDGGDKTYVVTIAPEDLHGFRHILLSEHDQSLLDCFRFETSHKKVLM